MGGGDVQNGRGEREPGTGGDGETRLGSQEDSGDLFFFSRALFALVGLFSRALFALVGLFSRAL